MAERPVKKPVEGPMEGAEWDIGDPELDERAEAAICKVVNIEAARKAEEEAKREARRRATNTKELELNWAIAPHDVKHKLRRMREFLSKGMYVEVLLAKKRSGRPATREEANWIYNAIREAADAVRGTRETRREEGEVNGVMKIFFEGPSAKKREQFAQEDAMRAANRTSEEGEEGEATAQAEGQEQGQEQQEAQEQVQEQVQEQTQEPRVREGSS